MYNCFSHAKFNIKTTTRFGTARFVIYIVCFSHRVKYVRLKTHAARCVSIHKPQSCSLNKKNLSVCSCVQVRSPNARGVWVC